MPTIEVQAIDTLFFRDGKPFEMGDDNWAEGIFPPPPSVIYGALRSAYFAQHPDEISNANTKDDPTSKLVIKGIYLKWDEKKYLPAPLDLVFDKNYDDEHLFHLKLVENKKFYNNYPYYYIPFFNGEAINSQGAYLQDSVIKNYYLKNDLTDLNDGISSLNIKNYYSKEPKIGNALNNKTRSASEGKLYRTGILRTKEIFDDDLGEFKQLKIVIEFDNLKLSETKNGLLKLGAENKTAIYNLTVNKLDLTLNDEIISKYFKLIVLTPAISKNGNTPDFNMIFENEIPTIISAFVGTSTAIGGWDMNKKEPKEMYRVIPAGSVYYLEFEKETTINELYNKINTISISSERKNEGFGLFYLANLNINNLTIKL